VARQVTDNFLPARLNSYSCVTPVALFLEKLKKGVPKEICRQFSQKVSSGEKLKYVYTGLLGGWD
jgi:hypothetical protein